MRYIIALFILFLVSCGQDLTTSTTRGSTQNFSAMTCSCSDQSAPVCAFTGAQYVTFLNGCIAQCNGFTYRSGSCTPTTTCNENSGQVCGLPPQTTTPTWYINECVLISAQATSVSASNCP